MEIYILIIYAAMLKWSHKAQYFEFFNLKGNINEKETIKLWGDAIKVKLYAGAEVSAWVSDENYSYPGIVYANNRKTAYISFDPTEVETKKGKEVITAVLGQFK